ncbi:hypothetical protein BH11ACT6_BH11ACT6_13420 [soil metagenome]
MAEPREEALPAEPLLFSEPGATWYWMLAGPAAAAAIIAIQVASGAGLQWLVPVAFLFLVSAFIGVQIKAARIHTSVELTPSHLRQGAQTISVDEIVAVYPAAKNGMRSYYDDRRLYKDAGKGNSSKSTSAKSNALANRAMKKAGLDPADLPDTPEPPSRDSEADAKAAAIAHKWQSSRALGELVGVPRGRTGVGLKLTGGRTAQAWARRPQDLREALTELVEQRRNTTGSSA